MSSVRQVVYIILFFFFLLVLPSLPTVLTSRSQDAVGPGGRFEIPLMGMFLFYYIQRRAWFLQGGCMRVCESEGGKGRG